MALPRYEIERRLGNCWSAERYADVPVVVFVPVGALPALMDQSVAAKFFWADVGVDEALKRSLPDASRRWSGLQVCGHVRRRYWSVRIWISSMAPRNEGLRPPVVENAGRPPPA